MAQEEEVLGKAYDSRLMKRLLQYLRPYRWQVDDRPGLDSAESRGRCSGALSHQSCHRPVPGTGSGRALAAGSLSEQPAPWSASPRLLPSYVGLLIFSFLLDFLQTYFMQWAGQMVMFDLRSQIFRHLQRMHIGFYDKNPVGRLVTRVTIGCRRVERNVHLRRGLDLRRHFRSGRDRMVIMLRMNWKLALITFAVLPLIAFATKIFRDKVRDSYRRIRTAIARINAYMQEHVSGMVVLQLFNREKRAFNKFSEVNAVHMDAFKDAIMAHAVYYPVSKFCLRLRSRV